MSSQIAVQSIDALKDLRTAMAIYGEDTLASLGGVQSEVRRTNQWLQQEGPAYWQDQIKRRRERVAAAQAEVFRRQLAKTAHSSPSMTEQLENLRRAEAALQDAERRLTLTRKWQRQFQQAIFEYQGTIRRLKTLASAEVPGAVNLLGRLIDALEAYLQVSPPSGSSLEETTSLPPAMESIATKMLAEEPAEHAVPVDEDEPVELPAGDEAATDHP